jgi:hypothetical protein
MQTLEPSSKNRQDRVLLCAATVTFLIALDSSLLNVSFPAIRNDFLGVSASALAWVINIYSLTLAVLLVPAGRMADRWGNKITLTAGFAAFTLGALCCGVSLTAGQLVIWRFLQAVGGAMALPASLAIILTNFHGKERAIAVGKWSAAGGIAAAVGPPLGAIIMHKRSWRLLFLLHIPICLWELILISKVLENSGNSVATPGISRAISPIAAGIGLMVAAVTVPLMPLSAVCAALLAGALMVFLGARLAHSDSLIRESFGGRGTALACLATFCFGGTFGALFIAYDLALVGRLHFSIPAAALLLTPIPLLSVPVARRSGQLHQRWSGGLIIATGGLLLFLSALFFLIVLLNARFNAFVWSAIVILAGAGIGLCFPGVSLAGVRDVPANYFAVASGLNQSCRHMGTVMGVAAITLSSGPMTGDFLAAWGLLACFCFGTILTSALFSSAPKFLGVAHD